MNVSANVVRLGLTAFVLPMTLCGLAATNRTVPKDVGVAGFDDVNYATLATPCLTTMHQPCDELAALAFEMLMARIRNPSSPVRETFLTAPLVVRDSTRRSKKKV